MKKRITMTESLCMRDTKKFLGNIMKVPHFIGNYPGIRVEKKEIQKKSGKFSGKPKHWI